MKQNACSILILLLGLALGPTAFSQLGPTGSPNKEVASGAQENSAAANPVCDIVKSGSGFAIKMGTTIYDEGSSRDEILSKVIKKNCRRDHKRPCFFSDDKDQRRSIGFVQENGEKLSFGSYDSCSMASSTMQTLLLNGLCNSFQELQVTGGLRASCGVPKPWQDCQKTFKICVRTIGLETCIKDREICAGRSPADFKD